MPKRIIKINDFTVEFEDSPKIHKKVFERVIDFFTKHEAFCGESIEQCDDPVIDAPTVFSDIADDIIKFKVKYNDE